MIKNFKNYIKHLTIYLISFFINYLIFIISMFMIESSNIILICIVNIICFIISMLFIFYVDKRFVPDLVDENNSTELFKFILTRVFSLIIELVILYVFISILSQNHYLVKLISLTLLFILNSFYVKHIKFK